VRRAALFLTLASLCPFARAADGDSPETVVRAVYDAISGPAGPRDWDRFRSLFAAGARLISMHPTPAGPAATVLTPDEYAKRAGATFEKNGFFEVEIARRAEAFGAIAHVFSTYESRHSPGEKPFARGINSFQLVKDGSLWKIMTILWDSEREDNPIPQKYLGPGGAGRVAP
jgi:hypothetical protein